jgi:hypothetical protein
MIAEAPQGTGKLNIVARPRGRGSKFSDRTATPSVQASRRNFRADSCN